MSVARRPESLSFNEALAVTGRLFQKIVFDADRRFLALHEPFNFRRSAALDEQNSLNGGPRPEVDRAAGYIRYSPACPRGVI